MITLCVPTKDRSHFVKRLLRYYTQTQSPYALLLGDSSSDPQHREHNQRAVEAAARHINVTYRHCPGLSSCACLEELSGLVATPYSAFVGDDDILCTRGLAQCVAFLEAHPDYGAAHGKGIMLQTEGDQPYGAIRYAKPYRQAIVTAATGAERLKKFLPHHCPLLYSVHRTEIWQAMFRGLSAMSGNQNTNIFKDELIATGISVIRGKVKELDCLTLIRQPHDGTSRYPHVYAWLTSEGWHPSFRLFEARLIEELQRQDGLTAAQGPDVIQEAFWPYLAHAVTHAWEVDTCLAAPPVTKRVNSALRARVKQLPGARRAWQALQAWARRVRPVRDNGDPLSLAALLQPTSPYHQDFLPVYQVMTGAAGAASSRAVEPVAVGEAA